MIRQMTMTMTMMSVDQVGRCHICSVFCSQMVPAEHGATPSCLCVNMNAEIVHFEEKRASAYKVDIEQTRVEEAALTMEAS
jgi:hypothetical protein